MANLCYIVIFIYSTLSYSSSSQCGFPEIDSSRVIGGNNARKGAWPWQIVLLYNGEATCGGSILSPNWVITAAHCVVHPRNGKMRPAEMHTIRAGEHDRDKEEETEKTYNVSKIIIHPSFSPRFLKYDIALLNIERPIMLNKFVKSVCLPRFPVVVGERCYITGWGRQNRKSKSMHHVLQQAQMPVIDSETCAAAMKFVAPLPIGAHSLCSGYGKGKVSGCQGDSGGPFVCRVKGKWYLQGVVSWGSKQCSEKKNLFSVYANVFNVKTWIQNEMKYSP